MINVNIFSLLILTAMYDIKFKVGDKVYPIISNSKSEQVPCPICDQTGSIDYRHHRLTCPECNGRKFVWKKNSTWEPGKASKVAEINIRVTKISCVLKEPTRNEQYYYGQRSFDINDCFKTLDEAVDACDARNHNNSCC